uniref:Uncharacterized protein n=1 Tax=Arundo donax TaxID=35708 RepID=A0A0A8Z1L7_ARUDO
MAPEAVRAVHSACPGGWQQQQPGEGREAVSGAASLGGL